MAGEWEARNRLDLIEALEAARQAVCAYPEGRPCDCKYGLISGGEQQHARFGAEHTGCPELRDLIRQQAEVAR